MINDVLSIKDGISYACEWIRPYTFKCGKCNRGIIQVWPGENRMGFHQDRKICLVCKSKFKVTEISR